MGQKVANKLQAGEKKVKPTEKKALHTSNLLHEKKMHLVPVIVTDWLISLAILPKW